MSLYNQFGKKDPDLSQRMLDWASHDLLEAFSRPRDFPGYSPLVDQFGKPLQAKGTDTITFRRYKPFKERKAE